MSVESTLPDKGGSFELPASGTTERRPRLSVVIVSHNCRSLLERCLASLDRERGLIDAEVIVVDNASTDDTWSMLHDQFEWVRAIDAGGNVGFARGNNLGLRGAAGEYVLLLNPDTVVPRGALVASVDALEVRAEVGMLGCKLLKPDGSLDHACKRGFPTPLSAVWHFVGLSRLRPHSRIFASYTAGHVNPDEEALVDAVNGAFMLVRREALAQVGELDEGYWLYMEDLDWCYRFSDAGWPVVYWPGASVIHVKAGSSGRHRTWRINRAFHGGMWRFYRKHYFHSRSRLVSGAVWLGIWVKLLVSAARSATVRRLS